MKKFVIPIIIFGLTGAFILILNSMIYVAYGQVEVIDCFPNPHDIYEHNIGPIVTAYIPSSIKESQPSVNASPIADEIKANGSGFSFGIKYFLRRFPGLNLTSTGILQLQINYDYYHLISEKTEINKFFLSQIVVGDVSKSGIMNFDYENKISQLSLSTFYSHTVVGNLFISLGIKLGFVLNNKTTEILVITNKYKSEIKFKDNFSPITFENNKQIAILQDGDTPGLNKTTLSLKPEIGYNILSPGKFSLIPVIGYEYYLTKLSKDYNLRLTSWYVQLMLNYYFDVHVY